MKGKTINNTIEKKIKPYSLLSGFGLALFFALVMYDNYRYKKVEKSYPPTSEVSHYTSYKLDEETILIPTRK
ncbi:hypothetical protein [Dysgonomonas sp. GY617]|uniref:hypothetical protein n=1 Tax=Dysgonomonas sp. GY617 TaxID=2780420 RepID=UPI001884029E|nr:hypothetical protein [Dysgonomonas sp. GY617]MBF0577704.1 hypothetical protein [Dysgonomonas sp. GY617]